MAAFRLVHLYNITDHCKSNQALPKSIDFQLSVVSDESPIFEPGTKVFFVASGHISAMGTLGQVVKQHSSVEGLTVPEPNW